MNSSDCKAASRAVRLLLTSLLALLCSVALGRPSTQTFQHTFTYHADRDLTSVNVAGTFNGWDKAATPMKQNGRTWTATVLLPLGKVQYKFVLNGSEWIPDPENKLTYDDGNGNINSLLVVLPPDYAKPAMIGDGVIATSALFHDQSAEYLNFDGGKLQISLRVRPNDIQTVAVIVNGKSYTMGHRSGDDMYEKVEADVLWDRKTDLDYRFRLQDGDRMEWFGSKGLTDGFNESSPFHVDAKTFTPFVVPSWPEHSVIYQIFPDRFADGDKSNDPADVMPWDGKPTFSNFFGGDIAGVEEHIPYLKELGIKAIYFNPIFASHSNHGYETDDYYKVEPRLGTNEEFIKLCKDLHQAGIKVVLDGVFNHTSTHFFAFRDVMKNGPDSPYKDWYFIKSYPVTVTDPPPYVGWFGYSSLPKLHIDNPGTEKYMLGVPHYWDEAAHVDGWRLDAANEVLDSYWQAFRKQVKNDSPNEWIMGEVWTDASHWLGGDMWDSVMGYQFRQDALDFLATKTEGPSRFMERLMDIYTSYPPQVSRNLMNLLGSHDTARFLTLCHGDKNLLMLGATLQLTWPGAPSVYYGDEIGMEGGPDPDERRPMRWDLVNKQNPVLEHYKALIHARDESNALEVGEPVQLEADDSSQTLAYAREGSDLALVAVNRSDSAQNVALDLAHKLKWPQNGLGEEFEDVLSGKHYHVEDGTIHISLNPEGSSVLLPLKEAESVRAGLK